MKLPRRAFLHLAAGVASLPAMPRFAGALGYPARPVRLVVGFPAGGVSDILARLIGQWLQERLGQPFVIENRPGAASNIAAEAVAKAPPDRYTLFLTTSANAISASLHAKLNYNFVRDFVHVAGIAKGPLVMQVNPMVPANTVPEFIAYAKVNPGKLNMASNGNGSTSHLAGELFKMMSGVNMQHVAYRGAALALPDLIGGQVQVMFDNVSSSIEQIRAGKVRALAVTTPARSEALPGVPTVAEFLPGYEASAWNGVGAPGNTPIEIVDQLNKEINSGLADPKIKARFDSLGSVPMPTTMTSSDFEQFVAGETEKWAKVIKFAGIGPT
jgi:tripartite-type tricarboxylate transporter receptor subunit TctC